MTALLLLAALAAPLRADVFSAKEAKWEAQGFGVRERVSRSAGALTAAAVVYTPKDGGGDRLEIYVATKDKAFLGYVHPSTVERLELEPSPAGRFTDLLEDGSRVVAYRATRPAIASTELNIVRWDRRFKLERAAVFPEGRFLTLDGKPAVSSRDLPLGRFLSVACEDFGTMSRTAFRTTLHAARKGKFVDVSADFPSFYESEVARKEKAMKGLKSSLETNAGEYLGLALSSYYDYAAMGKSKEGWTKLRAFFELPAYAPPAAKACLAAMEKDLRGKLGVPADWP